jgi:1-deoxy-D-xylulose-5-phosphate reductoisomerase
MMAHMGAPDMRHAIGYALNWPERRDLPVERLDLARIGTLNFRAPDMRRYPALRLAYEVMATGGLAGAAFNAAKERALDGFIDGHIGFMDMAVVVERVLDMLSSDTGLNNVDITLDNVLNMDQIARQHAGDAIKTLMA